MVKEDNLYPKVSARLRQLYIKGIYFCDNNCANRVIRNFFLKACFPNPVKRNYILKEFDVEEVKKRRISFPLPLPPMEEER